MCCAERQLIAHLLPNQLPLQVTWGLDPSAIARLFYSLTCALGYRVLQLGVCLEASRCRPHNHMYPLNNIRADVVQLLLAAHIRYH
jgi:hypothetical protein